MIIINADDWGRSEAETGAARDCYRAGRITSVTAMVFMADSERAARLAQAGSIDVGLHLNLIEPFSATAVPSELTERHCRVVRFLSRSKYASLVYSPKLAEDFRYVYEAQFEEFLRLYGRPPTHIDGHKHQHLCANMLLSGIIPHGQKIRGTFYFWPRERNVLNRAYRSLVNRFIRSRYRGTDYFFALGQCLGRERLRRVVSLARSATVELMIHPVNAAERAYITSDDFLADFDGVKRGGYANLQ